VNALQRNSTLETLRLLDNELDESAYETLTSVLLVNTSLTELAVRSAHLDRTWLHPFFVALRMNTSLKKLAVGFLSLLDELVCASLRDAFAKNSSLQELLLGFTGSV
jgi:hypothetical protein